MKSYSRHIPTNQGVSDAAAEVCLNLWYFIDDTGIVIRLAGKAYALVGSDEEKLALLRALSGSDHLTATQTKVPANHKFISDGRELSGAVPVSVLAQHHSQVFGPLIEQLAKEIPECIRSVNDNYKRFRPALPQEPLCVTTAVYEQADGQLIARVSAAS